MKRDKLIYVVGTNFFYDIRILKILTRLMNGLLDVLEMKLSIAHILQTNRESKLIMILSIIALVLKNKITIFLQVLLHMRLKMFLRRK